MTNGITFQFEMCENGKEKKKKDKGIKKKIVLLFLQFNLFI